MRHIGQTTIDLQGFFKKKKNWKRFFSKLIWRETFQTSHISLYYM